MYWWSWILIWLALAILLVGTLVFFGWRLFKKGVAVVDELERLTDKVELLQRNVEELSIETPPNAILDGYSAVANRRDREKDRRATMRQLRRDTRMNRGRLITAPQAWEGWTDVR
ncbi:hypothetical protein [Agreia sp. Leaf210]|uniref:hypothetical protein n=1 Tax=Agreia sp. Leaf210 TaxID=1735682 RepID=UPI0006FB7F51|nr:MULTISPECIES: hypothetical protein [Microbacteriaceae]KQM58541.1 hypothetical protein ASE64_13775 [Agreia sp. Leaf210]PPF63697.1 hypothetical protein C5E11_06365 [Clavibacter michiganensis]